MSSGSMLRQKTPDIQSSRQTLCIAEPRPGHVLQHGDASFPASEARHYDSAQGRALEQCVLLKKKLRKATGEAFWKLLAEDLAQIAGSQVCFVSKRVFEGQDGRPLPLIGSPGSCLTAVAWYHNDGHGTQAAASNLQYYAFSCPCAYMKHDKVLLIPEGLERFAPTPDNPNAQNIPFPFEAYLAVPIFAEDNCVAHFGFCWSAEGAARRKLGWGFLEMMCHSFEELVASKLFDNGGTPMSKSRSLRLLRAHHRGHSLKPYARTLSHELRTPMHGVVGMLDLMYANVQDAVDRLETSNPREVFLNLRNDIEVIQDSSRRAIEAADNIVQAYDLDMGLHAAPNSASALNDAMSPVAAGGGSSSEGPPPRRGHKRRLSDTDFEITSPTGPDTFQALSAAERRKNLAVALRESQDLYDAQRDGESAQETAQTVSSKLLSSVGLGLQYTNVRDLLEYVVDESLKVGRRPESAVVQNTETGQVIDVAWTAFDGTLHSFAVEWTVEWSVPEIVLVEERDLAKLISCVLQNALKFTEQGKVVVAVSVVTETGNLSISISDTGPGIPHSFRDKIFNPFSREDYSTTRRREGLGLGLMVAKGLARKLGGDLILARAETEGPEQGSEFQISIPLSSSQETSKLAFPFSPGRPAPPTHFVRRSSSPESNSEPLRSPQYAASFDSTLTAHNTSAPTSHQYTEKHPDSTFPFSLTSVISTCKLKTPPLSPHPRALKLSTPETDWGCPSPPPPPASTPEAQASAPETNALDPPRSARNLATQRAKSHDASNRRLATEYPLTFLVVEDNIVNRMLLVNMLVKLGYDRQTQIYEAHDGTDAVNKVREAASAAHGCGAATAARGPIDVILMDLWMPLMDGYTATERILEMFKKLPGIGPRGLAGKRSISAPDDVPSAARLNHDAAPASPGAASTTAGAGGSQLQAPTILAVTADATDSAAERAARVGMQGFMMKPFKLKHLEKLIKEGWLKRAGVAERQRAE